MRKIAIGLISLLMISCANQENKTEERVENKKVEQEKEMNANEDQHWQDDDSRKPQQQRQQQQ